MGRVRQRPVILREVNVPLKTSEQCGEDFKKTFPADCEQNEDCRLFLLRAVHRIRKYFLCAQDTMESHSAARDTCQGDSGGPFAVQRSDGRFVLAGITSWGEQCGTGGYYTKVTEFREFINFHTSLQQQRKM